MKNFNNSCHIFFNEQLRKIIKEGIDKNELIPQSMNLIDGLLIFEKGVALIKMTQEDFDSFASCKLFINSIFDLIEVKK